MTTGSRQGLDRRGFIANAGSLLVAPVALSLGASLGAPGGLAQPTGQAGSLNPYRELAAIAAEAERLGLSVPRVSAGVTGGTDFDKLMPAIVDFLDNIQASAKTSTASVAEVEALLDRASALLQALNRAERSPPDRDPTSGAGAATVARPAFAELRQGYVELFDSCSIREQHIADVKWCAGKLSDSDNREQYNRVAEEVCAPWYFVGIIHAMEASFDFRTHLHNGDPLKARTVQVPSGRPPVWNPPNDWVSSAVDAMTFDHFADQQDWSLARTLYNWEGYNGWRSRAMGINTPYLWSFSNHYSKGKFVADNVWDANAESKQCGAAVMLKALVEQGLVVLPT
jgi:lysozyme family protein